MTPISSKDFFINFSRTPALAARTSRRFRVSSDTSSAAALDSYTFQSPLLPTISSHTFKKAFLLLCTLRSCSPSERKFSNIRLTEASSVTSTADTSLSTVLFNSSSAALFLSRSPFTHMAVAASAPIPATVETPASDAPAAPNPALALENIPPPARREA